MDPRVYTSDALRPTEGRDGPTTSTRVLSSSIACRRTLIRAFKPRDVERPTGPRFGPHKGISVGHLMDPDVATFICMNDFNADKNSLDWSGVPGAECLRPGWEPVL